MSVSALGTNMKSFPHKMLEIRFMLVNASSVCKYTHLTKTAFQ